MYQITIKLTRPSTDVEFYSVMGEDDDSVAFRNHWNISYKQTSKLIFLDNLISEDQLTMTTIMLWDSQTTYDEAMADPIVSNKWALRKQHNNANGIILLDRKTETIN